MKCSICHHNEASIYIEQNINGESRKYNLCGDCASAGDMSVNVNFIDPSQALSALHTFWFTPEAQQQKSKQPPEKICPGCAMSFASFKKTSMLGCAVCYDAFSSELLEVFGRLQPGTKHRGKIPKVKGAAFAKDREMAVHKEKLKALIAAEEYEEAAKIRDIIRRMEKSAEEGEQKNG